MLCKCKAVPRSCKNIDKNKADIPSKKEVSSQQDTTTFF